MTTLPSAQDKQLTAPGPCTLYLSRGPGPPCWLPLLVEPHSLPGLNRRTIVRDPRTLPAHHPPDRRGVVAGGRDVLTLGAQALFHALRGSLTLRWARSMARSHLAAA